jgi:hypothetical protein
MPRRPTRSKTNRPTRKEISRRLDDIGEDYGDLPNLTLCEVLSYETETVDSELGVVRIIETGDLRRHGDVDDDLLERLAE